MRRRLLRSTLAIALVAVVVLGLPLGVVGTLLLHQRADMRLERRAAGGFVRVRVGDRGRVDGPHAQAIFGRGVGAGSGIGLTVARELARRDGGDLLLVDTDPTTFAALFPVW